MEVIIRRIDKKIELEAKELIVRGLSEHFEDYDETKNPDLYSIVESYVDKGETFLVALFDNKVIGTGALIKEAEDVGRIVRMSVDKAHRGKGIAKKLVSCLEDSARIKNYRQIVLETNNDWYDAINLYKKCGYSQYAEDIEDVHFSKEL